MHHTHDRAAAEIDEILARSPLFAAIVGPLEAPAPTSAHWRLQFKGSRGQDELLNHTIDTIWQLKTPDGSALFQVKDTVIDRLGIELRASSDLSPDDVQRALAEAIDHPLMSASA